MDISFEHIHKFEITEDIFVIFNEEKDAWFIEDESEDDKITLISIDEDGFNYKDIFIANTQLEHFSKLIKNTKQD